MARKREGRNIKIIFMAVFLIHTTAKLLTHYLESVSYTHLTSSVDTSSTCLFKLSPLQQYIHFKLHRLVISNTDISIFLRVTCRGDRGLAYIRQK